jgi:hypothetical protein
MFGTGQIIKRTAFFIMRNRFADIRSKTGEEFQVFTCGGRGIIPKAADAKIKKTAKREIPVCQDNS